MRVAFMRALVSSAERLDEPTRSLARKALADVAAMPLIHLDAPDRRWTSWALWFAEMGYGGALRRGVKVNNYMIALQAAQDSVGLVLGWKRLVAPLLRTGALVSIDAFQIPAPTSFFLSTATQSNAAPGTQDLAQWIVSTAQVS